MAKPGGSRCNLDCTYCFYLEKEKLLGVGVMSDEVLEAYVKQRFQFAERDVEFTWQGGEPTLVGLPFFRKAVELQKRHGDGRPVRNAIQTNGVLLDDAWGEFLKENRFLVGLSVDGPEPLHDAYRPDRGGQPSFRKVMRGLNFLQKHEVDFNTLTVLHHLNAAQPLEVYDFLKSCGSRYLQFIPLVGREHSVLPEQFGEFMCTVFDRWVRHDVGEVVVQLFEVGLQAYLGIEPDLCMFRERCGEAVALEYTGDLFSCDHYVLPDHRLGNILQRPLELLLRLPQQKHFGALKSDSLPEYCRSCEVLLACRGECPKNRILETPDGEPGLNYLCAGYKRFFTHARPFMQFMAWCVHARRPLTDVMEWSQDSRAPSAPSRSPAA